MKHQIKMKFSDSLGLFLNLWDFFSTRYRGEDMRLAMYGALVEMTLKGWYAKEGNYFMLEDMNEEAFEWILKCIDTYEMKV